VTLTPACFYTEVINVAPTAEIERVDGLPMVTKDAQLRLSGRRSHDPDGDPLSYEWRATSGAVAATFGSGMEFDYLVPGSDDVTVTLTVRDRHGASAVASLGFVVQNRAADVAVTPQGPANPDGTYTVGRRLLFNAQAVDPDGHAITAYAFTLRPPPGADPNAYVFARDPVDPQTYASRRTSPVCGWSRSPPPTPSGSTAPARRR
jgi:hypothetical protein